MNARNRLRTDYQIAALRAWPMCAPARRAEDSILAELRPGSVFAASFLKISCVVARERLGVVAAGAPSPCVAGLLGSRVASLLGSDPATEPGSAAGATVAAGSASAGRRTGSRAGPRGGLATCADAAACP
jgi:hypothetical protein